MNRGKMNHTGNPEQRIGRRKFLSKTARTAATLSMVAAPAIRMTAASPNERIGAAVVGFNGMGRTHVRSLTHLPDQARLVKLCDLDPAVRKEGMKLHTREGGKDSPELCDHYESVIEDKSVDLVVVATPHHWHVPIALRALQAGKDVYCEKPASHTFDEGRLLVQAAKKYDRIFQHGTQTRSSEVTTAAREVLASGYLGEIKMTKAWNIQDRGNLPAAEDGDAPEGVDYDRWLGPASKRPFNRNRFHRTWRMYREYGNGDVGDDGIHDIDIARWFLGVDTHPVRITAHGSTVDLGGEREFPDNMTVAFQYPDDKVMLYEDRVWTPYPMHGFDSGNAIYGTDGYMIFSRRGYFQCYRGKGPKEEKGPGMEKRANRALEHMKDLLSSIRSRKPTIATAAEAHLSCGLVHLAEAAYRVERVLHFDPRTERIKDDNEAQALLTKEYRAPYGLPPQA